MDKVKPEEEIPQSEQPDKDATTQLPVRETTMANDKAQSQEDTIKKLVADQFSSLAKNVQDNTLDMFKSMRAHSEIKPFTMSNEMEGQTFIVHEGGIPALFRFKTTQHTDMGKGSADTPIRMHGMLSELKTNNKQIAESVEMCSGNLSTITLDYAPVNFAETIVNPRFKVNYLTSGITINDIAKSAFFQASDAINCTLMLLRYGRIIVVQPRKESLLGSSNITDAFVDAIELFEGDNPHPYLYCVYPDKAWFAQELVESAAIGQLSIGERDVFSVGNIKHHSKIRCVTDQFTAALLKQVFEERIMAPKLQEVEYRAQLLAMEFAGSQVNFGMHDSAQLYQYKPPDNIITLATNLLIAHPELWMNFAALHEKLLLSSNLLLVAPQQSMYNKLLSSGTAVDGNIFTVFTSLIPVIDEKIVYSYLIRELFAHHYKVTWVVQQEPMSFVEAFFILINNLVDRYCLPNLVAHGIDSFGYNIMKALKLALPAAFAQMTNAFGFTRIGGQIKSTSPQRLTADECRQNCCYTIFDPNINIRHPLLEEIRVFLTNQNLYTTRYIMERKRNAGLPYSHADYSSFRAFDIDLNGDQLHESPAKNTVWYLSNLFIRLWHEITSTNLSTTKVSNSYTIKILSYIQGELETIGPVLHAFESIQDHIRQGPGYVVCPIEEANCHFSPRWNVLCASDNMDYRIESSKQVGASESFTCQSGVFMSALLLTSASYDRQAGRPYQETSPRMAVFPDCSKIFDEYTRFIDLALRYADGITFYRLILENVQMLNQPDPLIRAAMVAFKAYSAEQIMRSIDEVMNIDLQKLFMIPSSRLLRDVRSVHLALRKQERNGAGVVQLPGSVFEAQDIPGASASRVAIMNMLLGMYLSQDTYFRPSGVGIVVSRRQVTDGIHPSQPFPHNLHRVNYVPGMFDMFANQHTRIQRFTYTDRLGNIQQIIDTSDPRLSEILLVVSTFGNIQIEHREWLFESVIQRRISIEATDQMFEYTYIMLNDPFSYSLEADTECIRTVMGSERASIPRIWAIDNRQNICTTTFGRVPAVTLSVWPLHGVREPVIASGAYNSLTRPPAYIGNRRAIAAVCGYGPEGPVPTMPVSRLPKLASLPNANNIIPVITDKITLVPTFDIIRIAPVKY